MIYVFIDTVSQLCYMRKKAISHVFWWGVWGLLFHQFSAKCWSKNTQSTTVTRTDRSVTRKTVQEMHLYLKKNAKTCSEIYTKK